MHNESLADRREEPIEKTSKLKKFGSRAIVAGIYVIPVAIGGTSAYYSLKIMQMNYKTAALNLAAATKAAAE